MKALTFLPEREGDQNTYLLTGSDDKTLILWRAPVGSTGFSPVQTISEHSGPVNCITALRTGGTSDAEWIVATGSADATIKTWRVSDEKLELLQTYKTSPKFFPLCLAISYMGNDNSSIAIAAAGTRNTIHILTAEAREHDQIIFSAQAVLPGHEEWIRSLSFSRETTDPDSDILLASASQDKYIRIWRFNQGKTLPALANGGDPSSGAYLPGKTPSNKAYWLKVAEQDYSVTFEALLLGHEDWIYSARWHTGEDGKLQLLSTSADNSLAIWEADPTSGVWVSMVRLGEISREKGATTATGSTGGFWTGLWSPDGTSVACLGRTGSWRRWEYIASDDAWRPCIAISGHVKAVTGVAWSGNGNYLLSTSSDQTTRLHMQWTATGTNTWHEMSRPQIHGYDLNCIDSLGPSKFVSGADEKLMRVFGKPRAVAGLLGKLNAAEVSVEDELPDAANMPVLGLSNKAIDTIDDSVEIAPIDDRDREAMDPASVVKKSYLEMDHPPFEETLSRHTLWPEMEKLYGHGYELSCLATSHDGKLVASACKASSINHAVIRLFETETWTEIRPPLTAHTLTATRLRFSPDDKYLLTVGRDRQWAVFLRHVDNDQEYSLLHANPKGHTRMILDAAWAPSTERQVFATAGRDKLVRIWGLRESKDGEPQFEQMAAVATDGPATAVDFLPSKVQGKMILAMAAGAEVGRLSLVVLDESGETKKIDLAPE